MYKYFGFGLCISSEIEFPELMPADFPLADLTISLGKTPEKLEGDHIITKPFSSIGRDGFLLNIKNISRYYAGNGNKIIAEPYVGIDNDSIRLFLLGTVIAAILYQRGCIPLHASAIIKEDKLVIFAGDSGAGKSTLLARLATNGHNVFTDDICVLKQNPPGKKGISGTASYPMIKLWEDAISQLDSGLFNKEFKIRPQLPKYGQFFYDTFNKNTIEVDKIFLLSPQNSADKISINALAGIKAFRQMEKQAYRYQLISNTNFRSSYFSLLSQLISDVPIFEVTRPVSGTNVELLAATIENLL